MAVASSAVAMAVTTETRTIDVEQEGHVSRQMIGGTSVANYPAQRGVMRVSWYMVQVSINLHFFLEPIFYLSKYSLS